MLFTLYQLEEAAVAICLYGLYNLMCISFLSIVMIKYTGKKKSTFGRKSSLCLKVPEGLQSIMVGKAWRRNVRWAWHSESRERTGSEASKLSPSFILPLASLCLLKVPPPPA